MQPIGTLPDGREVHAIELAADGLEARLLDHGARPAVLRRAGGANVCVAPDDLAAYQGAARYAGPVIGPVINRIAGARAVIDGRDYRFDANQDDRHTLHSGRAGTHDMTWDLLQAEPSSAILSVALPDGHGGFPGNREITVLYALEDGGLTVGIEAVTDAPTLMNPGLHGVFSVGGRLPASEMRLTIPAERYLPVTPETLPTGEIAPVADTPYDHRTARAPHPTLDHNFCFDAGFGLRARLEGAADLALEVHSDAPGLQAYAGGAVGVALEPQLWPDAPHHPAFPEIGLGPGERFRQRTRLILTTGP